MLMVPMMMRIIIIALSKVVAHDVTLKLVLRLQNVQVYSFTLQTCSSCVKVAIRCTYDVGWGGV